MMNINLNSTIRTILLFMHVALLLPACSLLEIKEQSQILESLGEITGDITVTSKIDGNVHVLLLTKETGILKIVNQYSAGSDGKYIFPVTTNTYYVAAYVDTNNDEIFQLNEPASYLGISKMVPRGVSVNAGEKITIENIQIKGNIKSVDSKNIIPDYPLVIKNIGRVVSLDDPMFQRSNASIGLWRPIDFIEKIGGGLFFLQEYDEKKIPVLFVHGANGTALDWEHVISSIDREKFQPWVLYYPSGVSLDLVSDYLLKSINTLQNRHNINQLYVIAHSMGGLVARSFIMKHTEAQSSVRVPFSMTVNSPMNGMESAKSGIHNSPIVVSSWRDVAKDSEFIQRVISWGLPADISYHLVFSYESGEGGDGVVSLESQIPLKLQTEAEKIHGFNSSHAGVLQDKKFITWFNTALEESLHKSFVCK